jgi:hypothetical protein
MSDAHRVMGTKWRLRLIMGITYHVVMHVHAVDYASPIVSPIRPEWTFLVAITSAIR